jgi:hypothetical protein
MMTCSPVSSTQVMTTLTFRPAGAVQDLRVDVRCRLRPDTLGLAQENVRSRGPDPGHLLQQIAQLGNVPVGLLPQASQITAPALRQQFYSVAELGCRALVIAPVAAAQRVDPLLPGRLGHATGIAHARVVQGAGGRDGGGGADACAEQEGQHKGAVQGLRGVPQPDARLLHIGAAVRGDEFLDDSLLFVTHDASLLTEAV